MTWSLILNIESIFVLVFDMLSNRCVAAVNLRMYPNVRFDNIQIVRLFTCNLRDRESIFDFSLENGNWISQKLNHQNVIQHDVFFRRRDGNDHNRNFLSRCMLYCRVKIIDVVIYTRQVSPSYTETSRGWNRKAASTTAGGTPGPCFGCSSSCRP